MEEGFDACIHKDLISIHCKVEKAVATYKYSVKRKQCALKFGSMIDIVDSDKVPDSLKCIYHDQKKGNKRKTKLPIRLRAYTRNEKDEQACLNIYP